MSKLYFAKYRPVEGEIKEGETGISINNATYTHFNHLGKNYGKPARLFLCSRDIKPEDYLKEGNVHIYHDSSEPPFKVIGEISPEAKWVKEGDEFDEDEIKRTYSERYYDFEAEEAEWDIHQIKGTDPDPKCKDSWHFNPIKIKCSNCKSFH